MEFLYLFKEFVLAAGIVAHMTVYNLSVFVNDEDRRHCCNVHCAFEFLVRVEQDGEIRPAFAFCEGFDLGRTAGIVDGYGDYRERTLFVPVRIVFAEGVEFEYARFAGEGPEGYDCRDERACECAFCDREGRGGAADLAVA